MEVMKESGGSFRIPLALLFLVLTLTRPSSSKAASAAPASSPSAVVTREVREEAVGVEEVEGAAASASAAAVPSFDGAGVPILAGCAWSGRPVSDGVQEGQPSAGAGGGGGAEFGAVRKVESVFAR